MNTPGLAIGCAPIGLGSRFAVDLRFLLDGLGPGLLDLYVLMPGNQQKTPADKHTFDPGSSTGFASHMIAPSDAFRPAIS